MAMSQAGAMARSDGLVTRQPTAAPKLTADSAPRIAAEAQARPIRSEGKVPTISTRRLSVTTLLCAWVNTQWITCTVPLPGSPGRPLHGRAAA